MNSINSQVIEKSSKITINDTLVEDKQYMVSFDGKNANVLMRNRNEGIYIGLDEEDLDGLFKNRHFGEKNKKPLEKKLADRLKKKHRTLKKNTSASSSIKKKSRRKKRKMKKIKKKGLIKKNKKRKRKKRRKKRNTTKKNRSYRDIITPTDDIFD